MKSYSRVASSAESWALEAERPPFLEAVEEGGRSFQEEGVVEEHPELKGFQEELEAVAAIETSRSVGKKGKLESPLKCV